MSEEGCRSPIGLDCCSCCLDLANGCEPEPGQGSHTSLGSPTSLNNFRQLREQLVFQNLNTDKLNNIMRQDSLESVVRDPCYLLNEGICNSNIDQTMLSILLFFHRRRRVDTRRNVDTLRRVDTRRNVDTLRRVDTRMNVDTRRRVDTLRTRPCHFLKWLILSSPIFESIP